jgi:hypothetical protein
LFIYNITFKVDTAIAKEWFQWQKEIHIPEIMETSLFHEYHFYELLDQDESEGTTYAVQFLTGERNNYDKYLQLFAPALRQKAIQKWGNRFIGFRTLLQEV